MNLDNLNKWLTLASNLGVLIGIIFLTVEINQNQESIDLQNSINLAEARDASFNTASSFRHLLLENLELLSVWERGSSDEILSSEEMIQYTHLCNEFLYGLLSLAVRMRALDLETEYEGILEGLGSRIKNIESFKACWNNAKGAFSDRGYSDVVSKIDEFSE